MHILYIHVSQVTDIYTFSYPGKWNIPCILLSIYIFPELLLWTILFVITMSPEEELRQFICTCKNIYLKSILLTFRVTASTGMNDTSSRSHAIFTINFTQVSNFNFFSFFLTQNLTTCDAPLRIKLPSLIPHYAHLKLSPLGKYFTSVVLFWFPL